MTFIVQPTCLSFNDALTRLEWCPTLEKRHTCPEGIAAATASISFSSAFEDKLTNWAETGIAMADATNGCRSTRVPSALAA